MGYTHFSGVDATLFKINGTQVTSTAAELNIMDGVNATAAEINGAADLSAQSSQMAAGSGFAGTGTVYKSSVVKQGDFIKTTIFIDLTGTKSKDTDLDIIGNTGAGAYIGQVTAAVNGTVVLGKLTCLEVPTTGADDIDLYSATEATGAYDGAVGGLTETALVTSGGAWAVGTSKFFSTVAANQYLYLTSGEAVAGTYDAGMLMLELWGI